MRDYEPEKMKKIAFAGIRRVREKAEAMEREGKNVVHFEIGQPDFVTPKYIRDAACKSLQEGNTRYTSNFGNLDLRKAIAAKLEKENNIHVNPANEVIVTVGGEEAMSVAVLSLIDAGDEVLISDPGYEPYASIIKLANAVPVYVPLEEENNWKFNLDELEARITEKTKMLILCTPANPTGTMMSRENLEKLSEICIKHDLLVVSDEAYERVTYDGNKHISIASLPGMKERTITIHSFSKSYSMCGFRIGYIATDKELARIFIRCHQKMVLCATSFAQDAALAALQQESDEIAHMLQEFDKRRMVIYNTFKELEIPCNKPQAAFYVFPNVSCLGMDGQTFAERFLEEYGVATVPGVEFGELGRNHIRISYATSLEQCEEGMRRLKEFVKKIREEN